MAATNLVLGEKQLVNTTDFSMSGEKRPASDIKNSTVSGHDTKIHIPSALVDGIPNVQPDTSVTVSTVEHKENPFSTKGLSLGAEFASKCTEIDIQADGKDTKVENLESLIEIRLKIAQSAMESSPKCRFWNTTTMEWDTSGLTDGDADTETMEMVCYSSHLSMFAVAMFAIIGGAVGGVLLIGVVIGVVVSRKNKKNASDEEESSAPLSVPLAGGSMEAGTELSTRRPPNSGGDIL